MKAKHKGMKKRAAGGMVDKDPMPMNDEGNPAVEKEAKAKTVGALGGEGAKKRMDRPHRASGGRVSSDKSPLSASSSKNPITSAGKC